MRLRFAGSLVLLLPTLATAQPSFDCRRAAARVEKAICSSLALSASDLRMAQLYRAGRTLSDGDTKARLRDQQVAWLRQRDQDADDAYDFSAALRQSYLERIESLETMVLETAVATIPDRPERSLEALELVHGAPAKAWRAYLLASGALGRQDFAGAARLFRQIAEATEDPYQLGELSERRFGADDYRDIATVLRHLRFAAARGPRIPCWLFSRHPETAYSAFAAYFGSTRDSFPAICDDLKILEIPEFAVLKETVYAMHGDASDPVGGGTIRHAVNRDRRLFLLKASLSPEHLEPVDAAEATWNRLREWSTQTPRQSALYQAMFEKRDQAIPAVARFYRRQGLSEPQATRAAQAAVDGYLVHAFPNDE